MPKISKRRRHHPTRGPKSVSGRKVVPSSPLTLWFVARRLIAALVHALIAGAVVTGLAYVFLDEWKWVIFFFTFPFGMIEWLVFAKRPSHPEGGAGNQILDAMIKLMLADLPIIANNVTSPVLVALLVWMSVPYVIWQYGLLGLIVPGGACVDIHVYSCFQARGEMTNLLVIYLGAMTVPAFLVGVLHRKVLREAIFHLPGYASKDDQGASGPLTSLVEGLGGLLEVIGLSNPLSRFNPRIFKMALITYLVILVVFMALLGMVDLWVMFRVQPQITAIFYQ